MHGIRLTYRTEKPELDMIKIGYTINNGYDMHGVVSSIKLIKENRKTIYVFTIDHHHKILMIR